MTEDVAAVLPTRFYEQALEEAERIQLSAAASVTGVDQELAALRVLLHKAIREHPTELALMLRGMDVLRRLVVTKYGLSRYEEAMLSAFAAETHRRLAERKEPGDDDEVA